MKTSCPHCGQHYDLDNSAAGLEATCESCGKNFVIDRKKRPDSMQKQSVTSCGNDDENWIMLCEVTRFICTFGFMFVGICFALYGGCKYDPDGYRVGDSAVRQIFCAANALVYVSIAIIFMLLAIFFKLHLKKNE